jgi:hypothetical protein
MHPSTMRGSPSMLHMQLRVLVSSEGAVGPSSSTSTSSVGRKVSRLRIVHQPCAAVTPALHVSMPAWMLLLCMGLVLQVVLLRMGLVLQLLVLGLQLLHVRGKVLLVGSRRGPLVLLGAGLCKGRSSSAHAAAIRRPLHACCNLRWLSCMCCRRWLHRLHMPCCMSCSWCWVRTCSSRSCAGSSGVGCTCLAGSTCTC